MSDVKPLTRSCEKRAVNVLVQPPNVRNPKRRKYLRNGTASKNKQASAMDANFFFLLSYLAVLALSSTKKRKAVVLQVDPYWLAQLNDSKSLVFNLLFA